jgi:hypothetical protein
MRRIVVLASPPLLVLTAAPAQAAVVSVGAGGNRGLRPADHHAHRAGPGRDLGLGGGCRQLAQPFIRTPDCSHLRSHPIRTPSSSGRSPRGASTTTASCTGSRPEGCPGVCASPLGSRPRRPVCPSRSAGPPPRRTSAMCSTSSTGWGAARGSHGARTRLPARVFGANGTPVLVKARRTYGFRVRTQRSAAQPLNRSDWSPVRSFAV